VRDAGNDLVYVCDKAFREVVLGQDARVSAKGRRVLIVEDEYLIAMNIEDQLTDEGHTVVAIASSANEAFSAAEAQKIDFATVDINLRDGATGPGIAAKLAVDYGISILFVTSDTSKVPSGRPEYLGVVCKPCSAASLTEALSRCTSPED
jgi:DNA-binding response OmpR family regulator